MDKKKKWLVVTAVIMILLVLLTPIPIYWKDGGSVTFKSLTYEVTKIHQLPSDIDEPFIEGLEVKILGITVYRETNE